MFKSFIIASLFMATSTVALAQAPFEGIIKFKGENKSISETSEVDWLVKGGKSRLDITSHTAEVPNMKTNLYFVQGGVKMQAEDGKGGRAIYDIPYAAFANSDFSTAFSVENTGKKARYANYECEEYVVRTTNSEVSCWVSLSTGINPSSFPSVVLGRGVFSVLQKNGVQGIPLKMTTKDFGGNITTDMEVISIQAASVSDNEFNVSQ
jgi:hypothetical protein